ncbi:hypothetical protein L1277_002965 [Okibacterium sp. HSC-33S16]|uniref:DUF7882 family protein n=1 Tax=Okibacterium sp. HSC-33S16 TaxID=2910965 RepID=UPI00209D7FEA|nr:ATP-dependent DNA ligase [Okibacterium sp. HSC-33S16]MCP2032852.1 hypothetical protein [Okibacterium sp. HSC-33S16]
MGTLTYNGSRSIEFDDRALAHLQIVIGAKLRRNEAFYLSWSGADDGRSTIWIHPTHSLTYDYLTNDKPALNRAWIDRLTECSFRPSGLVLLPEPEIDPAMLPDGAPATDRAAREPVGAGSH